jgi:hypothetical protein
VLHEGAYHSLAGKVARPLKLTEAEPAGLLAPRPDRRRASASCGRPASGVAI